MLFDVIYNVQVDYLFLLCVFEYVIIDANAWHRHYLVLIIHT